MDLDSDQNEYLKLQISIDFHYLKRVSKLLISISIFSFALAFSFSVFSIFPFPSHSFSFCFSSFLFSLFSHTIDRKYMFLVCNGILLLLAKCSLYSETTTFSLSSEFDTFVENESDSDMSTVNNIRDSLEDDEEEEMVREDVEENDQSVRPPDDGVEDVSLKDDFEEDEGDSVSLKDEFEEDEGDSVSLKDEFEEEEEDLETGDSEYQVMTSTEELNKKIEEFIRRMKEEMRIEAQSKTHLIAV